MPIPPFDPIECILPPHLGDPRDDAQLSPYRSEIVEVCQRFGTTPRRVEILRGFLGLRARLLGAGVEGFQWLGGSFLEDVEWREGRDPGDVDVVTTTMSPATREEAALVVQSDPTLLDQTSVKQRHQVDHFLLPAYLGPEAFADRAAYWIGLFSHRRDSIWKGMLRIPLTVGDGDARALELLDDGQAAEQEDPR